MRKDLLLAVLCLCVIYVKSNPIIISASEEQNVSQSKEAKIEEAGKKEEATLGVFDDRSSSTQDVPKKEGESLKSVQEGLLVEEYKQSSVVAETTGAVAKTDEKETGRQSSSSTSEDEDDDEDDDDDDDDLDLGIDDDDDDDDDGDDDDYFGGLFDDIIGDDDDDDDDDDEEDEPEPAPAPAAPVAPAASEVVEAVAEAGEDEVAEETAEGDVYADVTESESLIDKDPDNDVAFTNNVPEPIVVQPVPADDDEDEAEDDDDDDDDEEPDLDDLAGDDDDDDDDEDLEDDDDDDEDDDVDLEDALEAKRSRESKARAMDNSPSTTKIPSVYIAKYNRFVDQIIGKINRILGRSYDPVRVKIQARKTTNKTKTTKRKTTKRKSTRRPSTKKAAPTATNKMAEIEVARAHESETREPAFVLVSKASNSVPKVKNGTVEIRASTTKNKVKRTKTKSKTKKNKTKANNAKKAPKVRATLFGLSSLRRDGDVQVHTMTDHSTVKSDFVLGPLTLRVEKEFGRGTRRELKSATATTAEMFGRLNLRIVHGGAATLHSIKVLQPKQVRVDSVDNHEKTKEFMWRRSARLAKVVSRKLAAAVKSMLQPPPSA